MRVHNSVKSRPGTNETPVGVGAARFILQVAVSRLLIDDLALRCSVTVLFGISIVGYAYILVARHGRWTSRVNHLFHVAMSAAMVVMTWPIEMVLPTVAPMVFFVLASVWFVFVAARVSPGIRDRLTNSYYAVMMMAMVWMYAAMSGSLPGQIGHVSDHTLSGSPGLDAGMDVSGAEMSWTAAEPGWIAIVNAIATIGFAVAALYWPYRYCVECRTNPVPHTAQLAHLGLLCQACMAAGIAIMLGVLL